MPDPVYVVWALAALLSLLFFFYAFSAVSLWFQAMLSGAPIAVVQLLLLPMRHRGRRIVVNSYITLRKAGIDVSPYLLEAHFMAGGNLTKVTEALIFARDHDYEVSYNTACGWDLAGIDVPSSLSVAHKRGITQDGLAAFMNAEI